MEQLISNENPKTRKSTEYNGMELVVGIVLLDRIKNYDELINILLNMMKDEKSYEDKLKFNNEKDLREYFDDIVKKKKLTKDYLIKSIDLLSCFERENIECIYISGKINKHSEIDELNNGLCKLEAKSDVYIKQKNGEFIGLSVKQSKAATKSNYSVQKILGEETDKLLTETKKNYLTEQGFPKFNKLDREKVNALFYPKNKENPYMSKLKEEIEKNKQMISNFLVDKLYCSNVNYDVYEFDGTQLNKLIKLNDKSDITFEEYIPYYYDKSGEERKAAKLFYRLTCCDKIYRVEVRWKGNIHTASPQFQIHEE
jgi:hypothetical protein